MAAQMPKTVKSTEGNMMKTEDMMMPHGKSMQDLMKSDMMKDMNKCPNKK